MYKVRALSPAGITGTHACGTADQALDKVEELIGRGFSDIYVIEPGGKEQSAADFKRRALNGEA